MSAVEQEELIETSATTCSAYGPLEPLLARDDIADIMVNGSEQDLSSRSAARSSETDIRFRDNAQLMNICQRIVSPSAAGSTSRHPICDARLADGSAST